MAGFPNTTWARPLVEKQRENEGTRRVFHAAVPAGAAVREAPTTKEQVKARLMELLLDADGKISVMAASQLAKLEGMNAPDVDLKAHLAGMSVEERRAWCERTIQTCQAVLDDLPSRSSGPDPAT